MRNNEFEQYNMENNFVQKGAFYEFVKRGFDIFASLLFLIIFCWLYLIVAIAIKIEDGGSVIYVSKRVGKYGKEFNFYKFRSMCVDADKKLAELQKHNKNGVTFKMKDDPRVTKVGKFIRKFSIDEIPQIFNILKGDLSVVGPRSPLPHEVAQYNDYQKQRLAVKGGLTCYWQVMGRSKLPFSKMVELDLQYIRERGLIKDLSIILKTIPAIFKGDGAF